MSQKSFGLMIKLINFLDQDQHQDKKKSKIINEGSLLGLLPFKRSMSLS